MAIISFDTRDVKKTEYFDTEDFFSQISEIAADIIHYQNALTIKNHVDDFMKEINLASEQTNPPAPLIPSENLKKLRDTFHFRQDELIKNIKKYKTKASKMTEDNWVSANMRLFLQNEKYWNDLGVSMDFLDMNLTRSEKDILSNLKEIYLTDHEIYPSTIEYYENFEKNINPKSYTFADLYSLNILKVKAQSILFELCSENRDKYTNEIISNAVAGENIQYGVSRKKELKALTAGDNKCANVTDFTNYVENNKPNHHLNEANVILDLLLNLGQHIVNYSIDIEEKTKKWPSIKDLFKRDIHMGITGKVTHFNKSKVAISKHDKAEAFMRANKMQEFLQEIQPLFNKASLSTKTKVFEELVQRKKIANEHENNAMVHYKKLQHDTKKYYFENLGNISYDDDIAGVRAVFGAAHDMMSYLTRENVASFFKRDNNTQTINHQKERS